MRNSPTQLYRSITLCVWAHLPIAAFALDAAIVPPGLYDVKSQMVMPHMEEMRRIVKEEKRCVVDGPAALFPVLDQHALLGCKFDFPKQDDKAMNYLLVCESARVATGQAHFEGSSKSLVGTMQIKMGGKNMTFSQRVEAQRVGVCPD
jgi:hypothetical protein